MRAIIWGSLMGFCVGVLILHVIALCVVAEVDNRILFVVNIFIYVWAIRRGWTHRHNWL